MLSVPAELLEKLEHIAKVEKRSMASTCMVLIDEGLQSDRFKEILSRKKGSYLDLIPEDKRSAQAGEKMTPEKLKEAMALLEMLDKLKS